MQEKKLTIPLTTEEIDLKKLFHEILAEKRLILTIILITLMLGTCYALLKPLEYQADVLLQVMGKQENLGNLSHLPLKPYLESKATPDIIQSALIKSRFILGPVIESLGLDITVKPNYFPIFGAWYAHKHTEKLNKPLFWLNNFAWGGEQLNISHLNVPVEDQAKPFKLIATGNNSFQILSPSGEFITNGKIGKIAEIKNGTFSIFIEKMNANPGSEFFISKQSNNKLVNEIANRITIIDLGSQLSADNKTGILNISLKDSDPKQVTNILNKLVSILIAKDIDRKSLETEKTLDFLEKELPLLKKSLDVSETALSQYRIKSGSVDLSFESQILLRQIADTQKELEENKLNSSLLLKKYTAMHPYMIALQDKSLILESQLISLKHKLKTLPQSDQSAVSLMRDVKVKNELYLLLLNKIQELKVAQAGTISDVRVLNYATMPGSLVPTKRLVIMAISLVLGILLAMFTVVIRKSLYPKISDPFWVEKNFNIQTLATIPFSKIQKQTLENNQSFCRTTILAKNKPNDSTIEALRSLRTNLQISSMEAKNNIISIMGMTPGVGKTFTSINFSYLLAESEKKVLLIDGDLRKGQVKNYFETSTKLGLSEFLSGTADLKMVLQKTMHKNLDFIQSGHFLFNPSELLMKTSFNEALKILAKEYDFVIIDTPPILAVTDATIIANLAGTNLLIMGAEMHQTEEIESALKKLHINNINLLGYIFNHVNKETGRYRQYGYKYNYTYSQ